MKSRKQQKSGDSGGQTRRGRRNKEKGLKRIKYGGKPRKDGTGPRAQMGACLRRKTDAE